MPEPTQRPQRPRGLADAVTRALVAGDVPDARACELHEAGRYVEQSISGMPDTLRLGVRVAGLASGGLLGLLGRGRFRTLSPDRQRVVAERFAGLPLPVVGEYARLTRGLGLVSVFEGRSGAPNGTSSAAGGGR